MKKLASSKYIFLNKFCVVQKHYKSPFDGTNEFYKGEINSKGDKCGFGQLIFEDGTITGTFFNDRTHGMCKCDQ